MKRGSYTKGGGASKREIRHLENCGYRGKKDLYCADLHKIHVKQVDTPFFKMHHTASRLESMYITPEIPA